MPETAFNIITYITLFVVTILLIRGLVVYIYSYLQAKKIRYVRVSIDGKEGVIDLKSDELLIHQIDRIKKGK